MFYSFWETPILEISVNPNKLAPIIFNVFSMGDKLLSVNFNDFTATKHDLCV